MQALNHELFLLLNAPMHAHGAPVLLATFFATYLIYLLPIGLLGLAMTGSAKDRLGLVSAVLSALLALLLGLAVSTLWPQARPFALPLGTNLLPHVSDAGFPSDHALVFFGLGLGMLLQARVAWAAMLLLAAGLLVGWARIYLGVHFPADIVGAFPVALVSALIVRSAAGYVARYVAVPVEAGYQRLRRAALDVIARRVDSTRGRDSG